MKKLVYLIVLALILGLVLTGCLLSNVGQVPSSQQSGTSGMLKNGASSPITIGYGDVDLTSSGATDSGHFMEVWDLYACDMVISFTYDANGLVDDFGGDAHAWAELGIRQFGYPDFNPTWQVEGAGVWLATDYHYGVDTFDPFADDKPATSYLNGEEQDLDDKLILQKAGGHGEGDYNIPSAPPNPWNNHRVWWDRDGVDPWQNDETANTGGIYNVVITLTATSATTGEAYMKINGLDQGFETDGNWNTIELTPAGMTFTGDMTKMQVFYGLYGYGTTHSVDFEDITVEGCLAKCETDLIADQDIDVGNVVVEYIPDDDLMVTYNTEDGWLLDEIHFHVSTIGESGFPAKNGNPIPGKFDYKFKDLGGVDTYSFDIPLSEGTCGPIYFAAHAKVYKLSDVIDDEFIVSGSDTSNVDVFDVDPVTNPLATPTDSDISKIVNFAAWNNFVSLTTDFPLARWIIEYYDSLPPWEQVGWDPTKESWRLFTRNFDIPSNAVNISGMLKITADNAEQVLLNNNNVGSNGNWKTITQHSLNSGEFIAGNNELDIIVHNYFGAPSTINPTGLIYKLGYLYQLKTEETAWGEGIDFSGKNWAMYFGCPNFLPECQ